MPDFPGVVWPKILTGYEATLASLIVHLNATERMPLEHIRVMQGHQLSLLVKHHYENTPSFKARLDYLGVDPNSLKSVESLKTLAPINKAYIQQQGTKLFCERVPEPHQPVGKATTSGSTGEPIAVARSMLCNVLWEAMAIRDHQWWQRSFDLKYFSIRATITKEVRHDNWGAPVSRLYRTAPSMGMNVTTDISQLMSKIREFKPGILMLHAGVLGEMVNTWETSGFDVPSLRHIKNVGDTVWPELRDRLRAVSGLEIEDNYSSSETGTIAIQCPHSGLLHTCEEALIVEILREDNTPCEAGETGRVVVTDLQNFASPMIRYNLADYAEVGGGCSCGRTLPTLKRIIGRERNIFVRPDGSKFWPRASMKEIPKILPVRQWQMVQHSVDHIEYRLVSDSTPDESQTQKIAELLHEALGFKPKVTVTVLNSPIPRTKSGKFEECISLVPR